MWFTDSRNANLSDCVQRFVKHNLKKKRKENQVSFAVRRGGTEGGRSRREGGVGNNVQVPQPPHFPRNHSLFGKEWGMSWTCDKQTKPQNNENLLCGKAPLLLCLGRWTSLRQLGSASLQRKTERRSVQRWSRWQPEESLLLGNWLRF